MNRKTTMYVYSDKFNLDANLVHFHVAYNFSFHSFKSFIIFNLITETTIYIF